MILNKYTAKFTATHGIDHIKDVLAHCPQYMLEETIYVGPRKICIPYCYISKKMYRQYQRQLWDVSISEDIKDSFGSKTQNTSELDTRGKFTGHEARYHRFGTTCLLVLDTWSNRITMDGRIYPDRPLICTEQWSFLKNLFQWNEDLEVLIVCLDMPFTGRTPAEVDEVASLRTRTWQNDEWSCRDEEYMRLLEIFSDWKMLNQTEVFNL